jgi:hypothetical protein
MLNTAVVALDPPTLKFAPEKVGTKSKPQVVRLSNPGVVSAVISSIKIAGKDASDFEESANCGKELKGGKDCTVSIIFKPTEQGIRTATLELVDNALGKKQDVALSGEGRRSDKEF